MLALAVLIYALAMTLANLSVAVFGPALIPVNALVLIGLDLALRDWLHVRLRAVEMLALIAAAGALTYVFNPDAGRIGWAGSAAFTSAALVDWAVFSALRGPWLLRSNGSNAAGALVDSLVFPLAAGFSLAYVPVMFVAKLAGGAAWTLALARLRKLDTQPQ